MNTSFMLLAMYDGLPVIPLERVCKDFFTHLKPDHLAKKIMAGDVKLPLLRIEEGQKCAKGVYLIDLAAYIDGRAAAARRELDQITRAYGAPRGQALLNQTEGAGQ